MKPVFTFLPLALALAATSVASATAPLPAAPAPPTDTVVVRLPNQVVMTLVVRNAAQLRELKKYQLDSLTSRLAGYIDKTEAAAQAGTAEQLTMNFRPDDDHPGQHLPAEVRITARKPTPGQPQGSTRTEASLEAKPKKYGFSTDRDGVISYRPHRRSAPDDTLKQWKRRHHPLAGHFGLRLDIGPNTFVNNSARSAGVPSLRQWDGLFGGGVGYLNLGLNFVQPLTRGRARLAFTVGPELSTHRFVLTDNNQWQFANGVTTAGPALDGKQVERSRLTLTTLNVPLMLRFRLLKKSDHDVKTFSAGLGAFGGYRLSSGFSTEYKLPGSDLKHEDELSGRLGLRDWQYGVQAEVGFHALRLFARYNLNPLFEDGQGPDTHALAFGLRVLGF